MVISFIQLLRPNLEKSLTPLSLTPNPSAHPMMISSKYTPNSNISRGFHHDCSHPLTPPRHLSPALCGLQLSASALFCFSCSSPMVLLNVKSGHPYVASCHGFPSHSQILTRTPGACMTQPWCLSGPLLHTNHVDFLIPPLAQEDPAVPTPLGCSLPDVLRVVHPLLDIRVSAWRGCP